jgi:hypothetical protein
MNKPIAVILLFALSPVLTACVWKSMPEWAKLIIDEELGTYASIPCVVNGTLERDLVKNPNDARDPWKPLVLQDYANETTAGAIRGKGFRPDEKCRDATGFLQELGLLGLFFDLESRWTPEGEWRW